MLAYLPRVDEGPENERNLKLFPTPETERGAHVSDFLRGAILQPSSACRGSGPDCSKPRPNLLLRQKKRRAGEGEAEQNALWPCAPGHTLCLTNPRGVSLGNVQERLGWLLCTLLINLSFRGETDRDEGLSLGKARLCVCMMGSLQ